MIEYENLAKLNEPFFEEYEGKLKKLLRRGWFVLGSEVMEFEQKFSTYNDALFCIGVANGLDALTISLKSLNFKKGSEVIVPSNTYIASILAILNCGLIPIMVEPDISTYNINPLLIEEAISNKTVAILVVHLYGKCADMEKILTISNKYNLKVVEDCAQSHGAKFKDKKAGSFGDISAFSFYPTKNLGALGDAGCIITNNHELFSFSKKMRNYGSEIKYYNELPGINSRLDEVQALFLNIKINYLDEINNHKRKLASLYLENLKDDYVKPQVHEDFYDVYHIFNIRHPKRNSLKHYLFENEIMTEIHYPIPPFEQKALQHIKFNSKDFKISKLIHDTTLSLPLSFFHTENEVFRIIEVLNSF
jgi:dTDP-4-amino-4,6-dideoxygalactose transaminase